MNEDEGMLDHNGDEDKDGRGKKIDKDGGRIDCAFQDGIVAGDEGSKCE